jgi:[acyl-carrier-protein] S-malonyltransferase
MALALVFPGQGVQHPQMLQWLDHEPEAQPMLAAMAAVIGSGWRERLADTEWATSNVVAQPLLVGIALAAWACLAPRLGAPSVVAGYSVGELAAFGAAGALAPFTALRLARLRAACMDRSAAGARTGLLAVRDIPLESTNAWATQHGLALAIRLGPDSGIFGGLGFALEVAARDPAVAGARTTPIAARIASHTPWMREGAQEFARALASTPLGIPGAAIVCNFTAAASRRPEQLSHCLAAQIASTVLWDACMEAAAERNVTCVLEVGPGTTLSAMWRKAYPDIPARSIDEFRSAAAVAQWVDKTLSAGGCAAR